MAEPSVTETSDAEALSTTLLRKQYLDVFRAMVVSVILSDVDDFKAVNDQFARCLASRGS